ncbi:MAG: DNA polymerase I [Armatimonadota bacterium]|nr:DNA polymerase I [Armatimonadota bacterium]
MPRLVLIDGSGLVYRAFYALPYLTTSEGRPTNAVYGFTTMLLKVLEESSPDYIAVAFDKAIPTFRHEQYEEYKATRPKMPDDLRDQLGAVRQVVEAFRIPIFEVSGYEAEDVIATIARRAVEDGMEVLIVTGDLDMLQLVGPRVQVMVTSRGITETTIYDEVAVLRRFGLVPKQIPDLKGLIGDATDNIPGVPGVGEKTAIRLLREFGTVERLLAEAERISQDKLRERILAYSQQILQNKALTTIATDVPLQWEWDALQRVEPDVFRVRELFQQLEFRSLLERIGIEEPPPQGEYRTAANLEEVLEEIRGAPWIGVVLHSSGEHPLDRNLVGIAVCARPGRALYLPLPEGCLPAELAAALGDGTVQVTGDAKGDLLLLRGSPLFRGRRAFDVTIASYLLNPNKRTHTIETVAWDFLGWKLQPAKEEGELLRTAINPSSLCEQADVLLRLHSVLIERLREKELLPLFWEIEMPLVEVLASMELAGVAVDVSYLQELSGEMGERLRALGQEIYAMSGMEFNINSPKQLSFVLFEKLGLPALKKTKTGLSTDAEVLEALAPSHEIVAKILEYRELSKLKTTYVDVLPRMVHPATGRVHATFNQTVAATGRIVTTDPNLQNLPIRTEVGRKIRRAIVPGDRGNVLLGADYSQIELRILAHICRDEALLEVFRRGEDVHATTASEVFGVPKEAVTPEMRRKAKIINFGIIYGISEFGLSTQLGTSKGEAKAYIERYFQRYPKVHAYVQEIVKRARQDGYVTTLFGRRRYLPDIHSRNRAIREAAERTAINTPIQGTNADLIKKAMIDLYHRVLQPSPGVQMILQIHDELLFEVPRDGVQELAAKIREVMETVFPLAVPIVVEIKVGENWRDMETIPS